MGSTKQEALLRKVSRACMAASLLQTVGDLSLVPGRSMPRSLAFKRASVYCLVLQCTVHPPLSPAISELTFGCHVAPAA